jgi:multidrug efflux system membrane fusion protein
MDTQPIPPMAPTKTAQPQRRSRKGRLVVAGVVLVLVGVLVWRHPWTRAHKAAPVDAAALPQSVSVARASLGDIPITLAALGTVTPLTTVTVRSQISGYLTQIGFTEGQEVKRGDFLAQVDPRPYQAVLEQYEGNLQRDQALLRNAQHDLARYQHLSKLDSISGQNVDTQAALVAQYEGTVKTDQGLIDAEKLDIEYCHIVAPSDGRVGLRQVDQGNYVTPGDTNGIVVLTQLRPISVIFTLPQTELTPVLLRLRQGALGVTAYASDNTTVVGQGSVSTIDNQIDTTTGTVKLRALFANADETLFPNQFVNTVLLVATQHNAVVIPSEAVQRGTPGTFVYLVAADDTVSLRPITTGEAADGMTAVSAGLAVGDTVVTDGTSKLRAGTKVTIVTAQAKAQAAADAAADAMAPAPKKNRRGPGRGP